MKIGIKLHHHQRSKGPIDTYQVKRSPYTADYRQGCLILQAIRLHNHRASQACLVHLATFVTQSWENDLNPDKVNSTRQFMEHLLDTTGMERSPTLDQTIQQYCLKESPVPTVCPSITLLFAVKYIERLKQNYCSIKGTNGCSQRLILVAYIMAAKYIQTNLKFIIDTNLPPLKKDVTSSAKPERSIKSTLCSDSLLSTSLPASPPLSPLSSVSPKQPELTNPTQYHYFHSTRTPTSPQDNYLEQHHSSTNASPTQSESTPSLSSICSQFNYRVWRMENEFLHFLNEDIRVPDCLRLVEWANQVGGASSPLG